MEIRVSPLQPKKKLDNRVCRRSGCSGRAYSLKPVDSWNSGFTYSLWLNDRQPVKVVKTLNDRQFYIFDKFRKIE